MDDGEHLTRLEKLITLLEAKNPIVRQQAVSQLGSVCTSDSRSLGPLLDKLKAYLFSTNWDTRMACAGVIREIYRNLKIPLVQMTNDENDSGTDAMGGANDPDSFCGALQFNLDSLLNRGIFLLSSDGSEFDIAVVDKEKQWKLINRELGLDLKLGLTSRDLVSDGDLEIQVHSDGHQTEAYHHDKDDMEESLNLKSKRCRLFVEEGEEEMEFEVTSAESNENGEGQGYAIESLQQFLLGLCHELYDPKWTKRHGVVLGIKECVRCALCSRRTFLKNDLFLLKHLFCMLALDRFHDFVGNYMVAPVREGAAQIICMLNNASPPFVQRFVHAVVLQFLASRCWECRHDGLLIVKYVFASDHARSIYSPQLLEAVISCLNDANDDIVISAADALSPVVELFLSSEPSLAIFLTQKCWQMLPKFLSNGADASAKGLIQILLRSSGGFERGSVDRDLLVHLLPFIDHGIVEIRRLFLRLISKVVASGALSSPLPDTFLTALMPALFTRCLVETDEDICRDIQLLWTTLVHASDRNTLVKAICPMLGYWMSCLMVSDKNPVLSKDYFHLPTELYLGSDVILSFSEHQRAVIVSRVRLRSARLLASLMKSVFGCRLPLTAENTESPAESLVSLLLFHLNSRSTNQLIVICMLLCEVMKKLATEDEKNTKNKEDGEGKESENDGQVLPEGGGLEKVQQRLLFFLTDTAAVYEETVLCMSEVNSHCVEFWRFCRDAFCVDREVSSRQLPPSPCSFISPDEANRFCADLVTALQDSARLTIDETRRLHARYKTLCEKLDVISSDIVRIQRTLRAWLCCAAIRLRHLPSSYNPVVRPVMELIKADEPDDVLLPEVASCLCLFMELVSATTPSPNPKIIRNLMLSHSEHVLQMNHGQDTCRWSCIMAVPASLEEYNSVPASTFMSSAASLAVRCSSSLSSSNTGCVLKTIIRYFQESLPQKLPSLWSAISVIPTGHDPAPVLTTLQTLETVLPDLHCSLRRSLASSHLTTLCSLLEVTNCSVRHLAAMCISAFASTDLVSTMNIVLPRCLERLKEAATGVDCVCPRLGVAEMIACLVDQIDVGLKGLIHILASAVFSLMMDSNPSLRSCASHCFRHLIRIMPLDPCDAKVEGLCAELEALRADRVEFFHLLTCPAKLPPVSIPSTSVELRPYQKEGVKWLSFLVKYHLHGILCDDMGLGKTLQALCIMATVHATVPNKAKSLVLCPRTLTAHWANEVNKFFGKDQLLTAMVVESVDALASLNGCNVVIASYDFLRKEVACLTKDRKWLFCVLDEGHLIRNPKTQLFKAVMQTKAEHRLILSGTPVQNNILDVWTLFEFLMPGYLSSFQQFQQRYSKPVFQARSASASSAEAVAGQQALQALHSQVLPFILRRNKSEVLSDLPPKIVQDYYCTLTPLQRDMYEKFSELVKEDLTCGGNSSDTGGASRAGQRFKVAGFCIFNYLRKLCDHPALVISAKYDHHREVMKQLATRYACADINDLGLSGKMTALKQLLSECGIGGRDSQTESDMKMEFSSSSSVVSLHRALIFCQFRTVVDLIGSYMKQGAFGEVTFLQLDGAVPLGQRQAIVDRFNQDPSIDVLLLTTQVGGLGLNLTGADVVIFVDHDWNPMRDIQAMDRAHRIGQKRAVNVYHLITSGSLEEKIMRLQRFKTYTADMLIGENNRSLLSMKTDQLLDLLTLEPTSPTSAVSSLPLAPTKPIRGRKRKENGGGSGVMASEMVFDLPELWDESQYDEAFDLNTFLMSYSR